MRKTTNREHVEGRVYDHNLSLRTTGANSKHPGTEYINGTLDIATDDAGLNVVTVNFTYVTETTSKGTKNETFSVLKDLIDGGKTVLTDGMDGATMVRIDTALGLNDFYTNRNGKEELVSAKRNDGGFVHVTNKLDEEAKRNVFECDMLINGTRLVEADPEKHIPADYLVVKGAVFNFRNAILPIDFIVKNPGGIKYFESLDASSSNMVFTKVWGKIECQTIVDRREEESAFGEPAVKEYERKVREWVITGTAKEPYEMGDEQTGITVEEIKKALADRETALADIKKRNEEWQAQKAAASAAPTNIASAPAAVGGFNF
jgi:hypothetical protein